MKPLSHLKRLGINLRAYGDHRYETIWVADNHNNDLAGLEVITDLKSLEALHFDHLGYDSMQTRACRARGPSMIVPLMRVFPRSLRVFSIGDCAKASLLQGLPELLNRVQWGTRPNFRTLHVLTNYESDELPFVKAFSKSGVNMKIYWYCYARGYKGNKILEAERWTQMDRHHSYSLTTWVAAFALGAIICHFQKRNIILDVQEWRHIRGWRGYWRL
ncbi:hypothetical protein LZ31DRAFT_556519 [Colletotrichum somersetense]|nr:hypothetical protein LZ31DRAFT_556519 [Colletotrichum somersetense]